MMKKVRGLLRLLMNLPSTCNFIPSHGNLKQKMNLLAWMKTGTMKKKV